MTAATIDTSGWPGAGPLLATLQRSYRVIDSADRPDVAIAWGPRWIRAALAALEQDACVLVIDLHGGDAADLRLLHDAARNAGRSVVLADPWSEGLATAAARDAMHEKLSTGDLPVLVDIVLRTSRPLDADDRRDAVCWALLRSPVRISGTVPHELGELQHGELSAAGGAVPVRCSVERAVRDTVSVAVLTLTGGIQLDLTDGSDATPAHLQVSGPAGTLRQPAVYRSVYREGLLRVHRALVSGAADLATLDTYLARQQAAAH